MVCSNDLFILYFILIFYFYCFLFCVLIYFSVNTSQLQIYYLYPISANSGDI